MLQQAIHGCKIVAIDWVGVNNPFSPTPDSWTDGQMDGLTDRWAYQWKDIRADGHMDRMGEQTCGWAVMDKANQAFRQEQ